MTTKAKSHPIIKAKINPATILATVITRDDTFSPMAPWKAKVSVANLDDN